MNLNIGAKPWYPPPEGEATMDMYTSIVVHGTVETSFGDLDGALHESSNPTPDSSSSPCCIRRNNPYHSRIVHHTTDDDVGPYTSGSMYTTNEDNSTVQVRGGKHRSARGHLDYSELMYNAMHRQDLADGPPSYHDFVGQPYRSAPFRSQSFQSMDANGVDLEHHGVSASSHSGSNGSNAHTPRGAMQPTTETKPKPTPVAVTIPLPRSRRVVPAPDQVSTCPATSPAPSCGTSQVNSPVRPTHEAPDFPLPAPRSRIRKISDSESEEAEESMIAKLEAMIARNRAAAHASHLSTLTSPHEVAPTEVLPAVEEVHDKVPSEVLLEPVDKKKAKKTAAPKKKSDWITVDSHHKPIAPTSTTHKRAPTVAAPMAPTAVNNKFDLGNKRGGKAAAKGSDSDGDEPAPVIVFAATQHEKKKHHNKHKHDDEDAWLEEVAKAGAAAQEQHQRLALHEACSTDSLQFMGVMSLDALPNMGSLLPKKPSLGHLALASTFQKLLNEHADGNGAHYNALRRLLDKVSQPQIVSQSVGLAVGVLVELCEASVELDSGFAHARHAIQLARSHESLPLELLALIANARYTQKYLDVGDCKDDLRRALDIAIQIREQKAAGWIAHILGSSLEVGGCFAESILWQALAWRIGEKIHDRRLVCESITYISIATAAAGHIDQATALVATAENDRKQLGRAAEQHVVQNLSQACCQIGNLEEGYRYLARERESAKVMRDPSLHHLTHNIASILRSMGRVEEALQEYQDDMTAIDHASLTRDVDNMLGMASCFKQLGQIGRARDLVLKVLRTGRESNYQATFAKAHAEIADCDTKEGKFDEAIIHIAEGLRLIDQAAPNDCKQFYVKVNLCEAEWKNIEVLERLHVQRGQFVDAVRYGDAMRIPNTADANGLLQKRQGKALACTTNNAVNIRGDVGCAATQKKPSATSHTSRAAATLQQAESYIKSRFLSTQLLTEMLGDKQHGRVDAMVVYSLRWDDSVGYSAYVLKHNKDDTAPEIESHHVELQFTPAVLQVLIGTHSAFTRTYHEQHTTELREAYFDTPLFPQHYWYLQREFSLAQPEESARIATDLDYCLGLLYDAFVHPVEQWLQLGDSSLPRLLFVGDGVVNMIPFPALTCPRTRHVMLDRCLSTKLPSVQHALTIYAKRVALARGSPKVQTGVATVITTTESHKQAPNVVPDELSSMSKIITITDDEKTLEAYLHRPQVPTRHEIAHLDVETTDLLAMCKSFAEATLVPRVREKQLCNELFRAVFVEADTNMPLIIDLPIVPDVKEDYSGLVSTAIGTTLVTSSDIAITWELSAFPLVVSTRFGVHGTRGVHETGIPVHRALLLAGAQLLLLPVGGATSHVTPDSLDVVKAAINAKEASDIVLEVHNAMKKLRDAGHPVQLWCAFALLGLP